MADPGHYFVSAGPVLPRWREAFPGGRALRFDQPFSGEILMAWVRLPAGSAPGETLARVRDRLGKVPCVVLSDLPNDEEALACFAAAARGYCNSHATPILLQQAATVVLGGGLWIGESLMQRLIQASTRLPVRAAGPGPDWQTVLTDREREVAEAIAGGASNKEIALGLGVTERTVKAHVGAILEKLGVRDRLQLALKVSAGRMA